jgi:hypothetical protein
MSTKYLWTDGTDTYVACDRDELLRLRGELGSEGDDEDWEQIADAKAVSIWSGERGEPGVELVTKTAATWAADSEPGFLCSTEC